jgi:uncharacterized protein YndB with AHSA1/START domain
MRSASVVFDQEAPFILFALAALVLLFLAAAFLGLMPGARLDLSRSVLVRASAERSWEFVRNLPALHARHGKGRDYGVITDWSLRHGDGESTGSIWRARGTWRGSSYWADVEIVRVEPGKELTIRLRSDSLRTHRGLRNHSGTLTLEPAGDGTTKITWRLRARLRAPRLLVARALASARLRARLFDHGLRSLKIEIEQAAKKDAAVAGAPAEGRGVLAVPPPARVPPETTA